ncbi:unnamed protein product, partial [Ascophyllum nodosum]
DTTAVLGIQRTVVANRAFCALKLGKFVERARWSYNTLLPRTENREKTTRLHISNLSFAHSRHLRHRIELRAFGSRNKAPRYVLLLYCRSLFISNPHVLLRPLP